MMNESVGGSFLLRSGESLEVRDAQVADARRLVEFSNTVGGESDFLSFGGNEFQISVPEEERYIAGINSQKRELLLMGLVSGKLVSTLSLSRVFKARLEHIAELGLSVAKSHWGVGIGKRMCEVAISRSKERGVSKINLKVREDNERAIALYEKLGFRNEGLSTRSYRIGGEYFSNRLMGLEL